MNERKIPKVARGPCSDARGFERSRSVEAPDLQAVKQAYNTLLLPKEENIKNQQPSSSCNEPPGSVQGHSINNSPTTTGYVRKDEKNRQQVEKTKSEPVVTNGAASSLSKSNSKEFLWTSGRSAPSQMYPDTVTQIESDPGLLWQSPIPVYIEKVDEFGACPEVAGITVLRLRPELPFNILGDEKMKDLAVLGSQSPQSTRKRKSQAEQFLFDTTPSNVNREFSGMDRANSMLTANDGKVTVILECSGGKWRVELKPGTLCHVVLGETVSFLIQEKFLVTNGVSPTAQDGHDDTNISQENTWNSKSERFGGADAASGPEPSCPDSSSVRSEEKMPTFFCLLVPSKAGAGQLLQLLSSLLDVDIREPSDITYIGQTITSVGTTTANGIVTAGQYAAEGIKTAATLLKDIIPRGQAEGQEPRPEGEDSPNFTVDPTYKEYAANIRDGAAKAAETSSWMAEAAHEKVAGSGAHYGRKLAHAVEKKNIEMIEEEKNKPMPVIIESTPSSSRSASVPHSTCTENNSPVLLSKSAPAVCEDNTMIIDDTKPEEEEGLTDARIVGGAALDGLMKVFGAFETAAWSVVAGASTATTDLLEHRYGRDVGEFSKDVADGIGGGVTVIRSGLSMLPVPMALSAVQQAAKNDSIAQQAYAEVASLYRPGRSRSRGVINDSDSSSSAGSGTA